MSNLNHMICPNCEHDFHTEVAYATCDACGRFFYACESKTCKRGVPVGIVTITIPPNWNGGKTATSSVRMD